MPTELRDQPDGGPQTEPGGPGPGHGHKVRVGLSIAAFLVMAVFWVLVFTGAFNWTSPDRLHDQAWVTRAKATCTPVANFINDLPRAQTAKSPDERAATVDQATARLEQMVADLASSQPDNASDRKVVSAWLDDWRLYLRDRRDYTTRLRKDRLARPLFTEVHGGWSTDAIDTFAKGNDAVVCSTPADL